MTPARDRDRGRDGDRNGGRDRGASSVELVLAAPLLGLLLLLVVQFALWAHAVHIAQAAADDGVQAARVYRADPSAGRTEAAAILAQLAGTVLTDTRVGSARTATTATVTVTGVAIRVVPGLRLPVRATVTAPLETTGALP